MSGLVGVWNLDGRPLDPTVLSLMSASLQHRGPDGEGRWLTGSLGVACQHLWVTPEETDEIQPLVGRSGVVLGLDGRLDNREQLLAALRLPRAASDATCALAAYETWNDSFAERLNGDFAIVVFDQRQRRLLLVRDAIGVRPLYYFRSQCLFAFGSEIKALLAHPDIPTDPEDEGLADFMLTSSRPVDRQEITCFAGVMAVVPSHMILVTPERVVARRYWDFDVAREIRLGSFEDYVEGFRERFAEAVRRRIRSRHPVTISVSGGLDSSSIFCQANTLRHRGTAMASGPEIAGISYIGAEGSEADERRYLRDIERQYDITIERFPIEPLLGVVDGVDEQIRANEAPFLDYMWRVTRELHRRATARGSRVLLSGQWGDQVLFSSAYLVDLCRRLAWRKILRHRREYARWFGAEETRVLAHRFLLDLGRHYIPTLLVPPLKWVRRRVLGVERPRPWFAESFLGRGLRFAGRPAAIGSGFHSAQARSIYLEARSKYHVHCMEWNNKTCALHGLDAAFPFLDRDLLAFLMAVPGEMQNRNGVPRALLREAMRGVLPDTLRARTWKADFTNVVNRGVAEGVSEITRALSAESLGVRLGYFDASRLGPALQRLSGGLIGADCAASWDLADLYSFEVWLQVFLRGRVAGAADRSCQVQERVG